MKRSKTAFPGIPRNNKHDAVQDSITENIELLTGARGKNRALLLSDLINLDDMKRKSLIQSAIGNNNGGLPIVPGGGIEKPHAPVNLKGTGGFTFIAITWDKPNYKGHAYAEVFRADTDDFTTAVRIATEVSDIFSDSVAMGAKYYYWVRFINKADMKGPTQGANGLLVETQQSAEQILAEIDGQIERSHLGGLLTAEIDRIADLPLNVFEPGGLIDLVQIDVVNANTIANNVLANTENMALSLINRAILDDLNWENNTLELASILSEIGGVKATIESEFYTRVEANEAIAFSAQTIQTMIEENGTALSGDIESTYYTKATANEVITAAGETLKTAIENPNGESLGAILFTDHYTKTTANEAIAQANLVLKTAIEDPSGESLGATLYDGYYTKTTADEAIATAMTNLVSSLEDADGGSIGATLFNLYETTVERESALAKSLYNLKSEFKPSFEAIIENALGTDIEADRQRVITASITEKQKTLTNASEAIAESIQIFNAKFDESKTSIISVTRAFADNIKSTAEKFTLLSSKIGNVTADIYDLFYTKTTADEAISEAITQLKTTIENPDGSSVGADLFNKYYTKVTANNAIASANNTLKAEIEKADGTSVGAALQTLSETVATNDEQWAMWGVKATVGNITSSFGLVNNGSEPIFAIKGAKFAIITSQDPTNLTPVFAVSGGKTVIKSALIDKAFIQSLVTDDLLSNRVVVGSNLQTPSINYNPVSGARSQNFSMSPNGVMHAKAAVLESVVIKDANGNVVMSSTGAIPSENVTGLGGLALLNSLGYNSLSGKPTLGPFAGLAKLLSTNVTTYIEAGAIGSAQINQAYIAELFGANASFSGTVYAENIDGDVTDVLAKSSTAKTPLSGTTDHIVLSVNVTALPFVRTLVFSGLHAQGFSEFYVDGNGDSKVGFTFKLKSGTTVKDSFSRTGDSGSAEVVVSCKPLTVELAANTTATYTLTIQRTSNANGSYSHVSQKILVQAFKKGSTLS